ncbi:MAG TPA: DEAD/DEAH box helicase [Chloroflexota bacterium]|jgi:superfamily II RNA helicase|nr:DEAD/DEAH box helicase [Chloroflexota bacterium]
MPDLEPEFVGQYRFPFDDFQLEAMERIRLGGSVMVAAPTSAGKTVVAEYALWRTVRAGLRAVYTTPIKALSNQKRRDLEEMFPGDIGLLTGDRSENRDAAVIVMTTEVLRNMLLDDPASLATTGCVVFDEIHYLADPDRGTIWEESIIMCLPQIQLVCLSATIANAEEVASWIGQTHRPITLIRHDERPVPLEQYGFTAGALVVIRDAAGRRVRTLDHQRRAHGRQKRMSDAVTAPEDVVRALRKANLLPAIWFAFTRRGVEADAKLCGDGSATLSGERRDAVEAGIAAMLTAMPAEDRTLDQIERLTALLRRGIGFHHAGLLPPCKELVEDLFTRNLLLVVCATDTLSVGINMPARTVVISSMSRPVGGLLTPNDFSQLTGRAGRRGIDEQGAVVILPDPYHDFERGYAVINGPLDPVRSAFSLRYATMLSMFTGPRAEERLATLVRSSLKQFQLYGEARASESKLSALDAQLSTLHGIPGLDGREEELDQYLEIQGRITLAERSAAHRPPRSERNSRRRNRDASAEIIALKTLLRSHPIHHLAADPDFRVASAGRVDLLRQRNRLLRMIETARAERDRDATQTARAVGSVLRRLGYVDRTGLLPKADGLKAMVAPSGIVLSEMYHEGMLGHLTPAHLAEAVSWFACDIDRRRYNSFRLPHELWNVHSLADMVFRRISGLEERQGIRLAQGPSAWFWGVALAWCEGQSIEMISPYIEAGEGDIVSILNKAVDLLDQLRGMFLRYADQELLATTEGARRLLCRGLVAMLRSDVVPSQPVPAAMAT